MSNKGAVQSLLGFYFEKSFNSDWVYDNDAEMVALTDAIVALIEDTTRALFEDRIKMLEDKLTAALPTEDESTEYRCECGAYGETERKLTVEHKLECHKGIPF